MSSFASKFNFENLKETGKNVLSTGKEISSSILKYKKQLLLALPLSTAIGIGSAQAQAEEIPEVDFIELRAVKPSIETNIDTKLNGLIENIDIPKTDNVIVKAASFEEEVIAKNIKNSINVETIRNGVNYFVDNVSKDDYEKIIAPAIGTHPVFADLFNQHKKIDENLDADFFDIVEKIYFAQIQAQKINPNFAIDAKAGPQTIAYLESTLSKEKNPEVTISVVDDELTAEATAPELKDKAPLGLESDPENYEEDMSLTERKKLKYLSLFGSTDGFNSTTTEGKYLDHDPEHANEEFTQETEISAVADKEIIPLENVDIPKGMEEQVAEFKEMINSFKIVIDLYPAYNTPLTENNKNVLVQKFVDKLSGPNAYSDVNAKTQTGSVIVGSNGSAIQTSGNTPLLQKNAHLEVGRQVFYDFIDAKGDESAIFELISHGKMSSLLNNTYTGTDTYRPQNVTSVISGNFAARIFRALIGKNKEANPVTEVDQISHTGKSTVHKTTKILILYKLLETHSSEDLLALFDGKSYEEAQLMFESYGVDLGLIDFDNKYREDIGAITISSIGDNGVKVTRGVDIEFLSNLDIDIPNPTSETVLLNTHSSAEITVDATATSDVIIPENTAPEGFSDVSSASVINGLEGLGIIGVSTSGGSVEHVQDENGNISLINDLTVTQNGYQIVTVINATGEVIVTQVDTYETTITKYSQKKKKGQTITLHGDAEIQLTERIIIGAGYKAMLNIGDANDNTDIIDTNNKKDSSRLEISARVLVKIYDHIYAGAELELDTNGKVQVILPLLIGNNTGISFDISNGLVSVSQNLGSVSVSENQEINTSIAAYVHDIIGTASVNFILDEKEDFSPSEKQKFKNALDSVLADRDFREASIQEYVEFTQEIGGTVTDEGTKRHLIASTLYEAGNRLTPEIDIDPYANIREDHLIYSFGNFLAAFGVQINIERFDTEFTMVPQKTRTFFLNPELISADGSCLNIKELKHELSENEEYNIPQESIRVTLIDPENNSHDITADTRCMLDASESFKLETQLQYNRDSKVAEVIITLEKTEKITKENKSFDEGIYETSIEEVHQSVSLEEIDEDDIRSTIENMFAHHIMGVDINPDEYDFSQKLTRLYDSSEEVLNIMRQRWVGVDFTGEVLQSELNFKRQNGINRNLADFRQVMDISDEHLDEMLTELEKQAMTGEVQEYILEEPAIVMIQGKNGLTDTLILKAGTNLSNYGLVEKDGVILGQYSHCFGNLFMGKLISIPTENNNIIAEEFTGAISQELKKNTSGIRLLSTLDTRPVLEEEKSTYQETHVSSIIAEFEYNDTYVTHIEGGTTDTIDGIPRPTGTYAGIEFSNAENNTIRAIQDAYVRQYPHASQQEIDDFNQQIWQTGYDAGIVYNQAINAPWNGPTGSARENGLDNAPYGDRGLHWLKGKLNDFAIEQGIDPENIIWNETYDTNNVTGIPALNVHNEIDGSENNSNRHPRTAGEDRPVLNHEQSYEVTISEIGTTTHTEHVETETKHTSPKASGNIVEELDFMIENGQLSDEELLDVSTVELNVKDTVNNLF